MIEKIVIALAFTGIGGLVLYGGYQKLQTNREYQSADFLNGQRIPTGELVKLKGTISESEKTVTGPVTGDEKALVHYHVEYHRESNNRSDWRTLERGTEGGPVVLDTDSGEVIVDPKGTDANVYFTDEKNHTTRIDHKRLIRDDPDVSSHMEDFLERNDLTTEDGGLLNHAQNDYRRYTEESIDTGSEMVVFGKAENVTSEDYEGDSFNSPNAIIDSGTEDTSMVILDQEKIPFWDRFGPYFLLLVGGIFTVVGLFFFATLI